MKKAEPDPSERLSEEEATSLLEIYMADLRKCFVIAWECWEQYKTTLPDRFAETGSRARAALIHDFLKAAAKRIFEGRPDVVISEQGGIFLLTFQEKLSLRFKKLDRQLQPKNIETGQQQSFLKNLRLPGIPATTYATAGYILNRLMTDIDSLQIVRHEGKSVVWAFELGQTVDEIAVVPFEQPAPTRRVTAKKKLSEEERAAQEQAENQIKKIADEK